MLSLRKIFHSQTKNIQLFSSLLSLYLDFNIIFQPDVSLMVLDDQEVIEFRSHTEI